MVKVLLPERAAGVGVDRFRREIQFAAVLQHPHIVPVLTAGELAGLPYITMPYVNGESPWGPDRPRRRAAGGGGGPDPS